MTFTVELEYTDGTPEELKKHLYDIEVPALPPVGTLIALSREYQDEWLHQQVDYYKVEVVSQPELFAEFPDQEASYLLKVKPVDY